MLFGDTFISVFSVGRHQ